MGSFKDGELIKLEFKNGKPRIINYIGYPVNYGFIPKTLLPTSEGGDGDQLDILVLASLLFKEVKSLK